jgi:hypothetical protein
VRRCHTEIRQDLLGLVLVNIQIPLLTTQPRADPTGAGFPGCVFLPRVRVGGTPSDDAMEGLLPNSGLSNPPVGIGYRP